MAGVLSAAQGALGRALRDELEEEGGDLQAKPGAVSHGVQLEDDAGARRDAWRFTVHVVTPAVTVPMEADITGDTLRTFSDPAAAATWARRTAAAWVQLLRVQVQAHRR